MKKVLTLIIMLLVLSPMMVFAKEDKKVTVYVFYGETCPHCHELFKFLDSIEKEYGKYYQVKKIETWNDSINKEMMFETAESIEVEDDALKEIAKMCDGAMRDAIGTLDQLSSYSDK